LLGTLRLYVLRAGLASGEQVQAVALEILQETVVEALAHAERYHSDGQPMAWLLGIAINMIRRRKTTNARLATREISLARLSSQASQPISEADLLDQLIPDPQNGPEQEIEADEQAHALLALVSDEDQRILRLALLDGFDRAALAERLGTSAGTARMRLHRALNRLRAAWSTRERNPQGEIQDE
jgi:RNA polymerase sigma-70 factor (ECF subfamily)